MTFQPDYLCHPKCAAQDALAEQLEARKAEADLIERLRTALEEIAKLGDVDCDVAPQIARKALAIACEGAEPVSKVG